SKKTAQWGYRTAITVAPQLVLVGLLLGIFVLGCYLIPGKPSEEKAHFVDLYKKNYDRCLRTLDLTEARYYASQLQFLDPTDIAYRGYVIKTEIMRNILSRPAVTQNGDGLTELEGL